MHIMFLVLFLTAKRNVATVISIKLDVKFYLESVENFEMISNFVKNVENRFELKFRFTSRTVERFLANPREYYYEYCPNLLNFLLRTKGRDMKCQLRKISCQNHVPSWEWNFVLNLTT